MSHKLPKSKGQTLLIVAITAAGLVITAVIFVYAIVIGLRGQKGLSNSLTAYYAAEAGVEEGILRARNPATVYPINNETITLNPTSPASDQIRVTINLTKVGEDITIDSTGIYRNVRRKFEVKVKKDPVNFEGGAGNYFLPYSWKEVTP